MIRVKDCKLLKETNDQNNTCYTTPLEHCYMFYECLDYLVKQNEGVLKK